MTSHEKPKLKQFSEILCCHWKTAVLHEVFSKTTVQPKPCVVTVCHCSSSGSSSAGVGGTGEEGVLSVSNSCSYPIGLELRSNCRPGAAWVRGSWPIAMQSWEAPGGGERVSSRLIYPRRFVRWGAPFKIPPGQWDKRKRSSDLSRLNQLLHLHVSPFICWKKKKKKASLCIFSGRRFHPVYHSASQHRHTNLSVCHLRGCVVAVCASGRLHSQRAQAMLFQLLFLTFTATTELFLHVSRRSKKL